MSLWILSKENMIVFKYQRLFSLSPLKLIQMRQKKNKKQNMIKMEKLLQIHDSLFKKWLFDP